MRSFFVVFIFTYKQEKVYCESHCLCQFPDMPDIVIYSLRQAVANLFHSILINATHFSRTDHFCTIIVVKVEEDNRGIRGCVLPGNTAPAVSHSELLEIECCIAQSLLQWGESLFKMAWLDFLLIIFSELTGRHSFVIVFVTRCKLNAPKDK